MSSAWPPQPEEADTANNERAVFLRSVGEKVRVLVAEGQPHWDTKFLVQSLKRDPNVDLTAVYRLNAEPPRGRGLHAGQRGARGAGPVPAHASRDGRLRRHRAGPRRRRLFRRQTETLLTEFVSRARRQPGLRPRQTLRRAVPAAGEAGAGGLGQRARRRPSSCDRRRPAATTPSSTSAPAGTLDELLERLPALDQVSVTLGEKPLAVVLATAARPGRARCCWPISATARARR